jgi:hypothetical protein
MTGLIATEMLEHIPASSYITGQVWDVNGGMDM